MPAHPRPLTIRGETYRTRTEATEALNVTLQALWIAEKTGTLDRVGLHPRGLRHGRQVEFNGKVYPSIAECARQNGIPYGSMQQYFKQR